MNIHHNAVLHAFSSCITILSERAHKNLLVINSTAYQQQSAMLWVRGGNRAMVSETDSTCDCNLSSEDSYQNFTTCFCL